MAAPAAVQRLVPTTATLIRSSRPASPATKRSGGGSGSSRKAAGHRGCVGSRIDKPRISCRLTMESTSTSREDSCHCLARVPGSFACSGTAPIRPSRTARHADSESSKASSRARSRRGPSDGRPRSAAVWAWSITTLSPRRHRWAGPAARPRPRRGAPGAVRRADRGRRSCGPPAGPGARRDP